MWVEFVQVLPPHRTAVRMVKGPWFLAKFAGSWILQELAPNETAVRFRYVLVVKVMPLGWLVEKVASSYFSRVVDKRLAGLRAFCETTG